VQEEEEKEKAGRGKKLEEKRIDLTHFDFWTLEAMSM